MAYHTSSIASFSAFEVWRMVTMTFTRAQARISTYRPYHQYPYLSITIPKTLRGEEDVLRADFAIDDLLLMKMLESSQHALYQSRSHGRWGTAAYDLARIEGAIGIKSWWSIILSVCMQSCNFSWTFSPLPMQNNATLSMLRRYIPNWMDDMNWHSSFPTENS